MLAHRKDAGQIGLQHQVPIFDPHQADNAVAADAGIVDQDLGLAMPRIKVLEKSFNGSKIPDIEFDQLQAFRLARRQAGLECLCRLGVARISRHHRGARLQQCLGNPPANAAGAASDYGLLAFEIISDH